jgi:hypothetical protein
MVKALRVLMPRGYQGAPLRLYRGTGADERRYHHYGFSWTTRLETARDFAESRGCSSVLKTDGSAVVLETIAPADAILLVREPGEYANGDFDEDEVVVDPYKLGQVKVVERLEALPPREKVARPSIVEIRGMKTLLECALNIVAKLEAVEIPGPLYGTVRVPPDELTVLDLCCAIDVADDRDEEPYYLEVILAAAEELRLDDDELVLDAVRGRLADIASPPLVR